MDTMNEIEKVPQVVQSTVYNALSGTKSMKVETLLYICEALGILSEHPEYWTKVKHQPFENVQNYT